MAIVADGARPTVRLLGPVVIDHAGQARPVEGRRRRTVLAVLALNRGSVVSADRLLELGWDGDLPASALNTLQSHVSRLRQLLGDPTVIQFREPGYRLDLARGGVDVEMAERLVDDARRTDEPARVRQLLDAALDLWRGEPLADVAGRSALHDHVARLEALRLRVRLARVEIGLQVGESAAVGELAALSGEFPYHEWIHEQLMLALYRAGRQAEALTVYRAVRRRLADDLGVDPGPALRERELAILRQDPALDPPPSIRDAAVTLARPVAEDTVPPTPTRPHGPAQLPHTADVFVGRAGDLEAIDAGAHRRIVALTGPGGVGKTALALCWAHRVAERFPDGQLYVNLRGFHSGGAPVDPVRVLAGFLEALGIPLSRIPVGLDQRAAAYRTALSSRRVLVVLDNARETAQVRPLLPGSDGCLVVVTSRDPLTPLAVTEGAYLRSIDLLSTVESYALLGRRLGATRLASEPDAAAAIVERCAGLPLALAIVAGRLAAHPQETLSQFAAELEHPLDALDGGDHGTNIRRVFELSYQTLSAPAAALFRALGLHPGCDIGVAAAAGAVGTSPDGVAPLLAELVRAYLVTEQPGPRYALHDLVHAYALDRAERDDTPAGRQAVLTRLFDGYRDRADQADDEWFAAEQRVLLAVIERASATGFDAHTSRLVRSTAAYLRSRYAWTDIVQIGQLGLAAAQRLGDEPVAAVLALDIARAEVELSQLDRAARFYRQALGLATGIDDLDTVARAESGLAHLATAGEDQTGGRAHAERALSLFQRLGDRVGELHVLNQLGWIDAQVGDFIRAADMCGRALSLAERLDDHRGRAMILDSLGFVHRGLGQHREAVDHYQRALAALTERTDTFCEAEIEANLADTYAEVGQTGAARTHWQRALVLMETIEHRDKDRVRAALAGPG